MLREKPEPLDDFYTFHEEESWGAVDLTEITATEPKRPGSIISASHEELLSHELALIEQKLSMVPASNTSLRQSLIALKASISKELEYVSDPNPQKRVCSYCCTPSSFIGRKSRQLVP